MAEFDELRSVVSGSVVLDVPMSEHTSMKVGGMCSCVFTPADADDIRKFIEWARRTGRRYLVIGAGTNLIVRDRGIRNPVLRIKDTLDTTDIEYEDAAVVRLRVGAGKPLAGLVKECAENGFAGIEPLAGIPGTVGGAVFMNAGTNKGCIADVIETVTFMERSGRTRTVAGKDMGFDYRTCKALSSSSVVLSALIGLKKADASIVRGKTESILREKARTQPLDHPSCGSIFRNPHKVKAWQLLDEAGMRGVRVRGAKYSELHTNFIVNTGSATADDILALIDAGVEKVKEKSGIKLELEAIIMGEQ